MLRSMLKVRNGSGWSRRATASAARPSDRRSAERSSATPSSKVSRRRSSTTPCKIAATVEDKVNSLRCEAQVGRHPGEPAQAGDLARSQVVRQDAGQVIVTGRDVQAEPGPMHGREL